MKQNDEKWQIHGSDVYDLERCLTKLQVSNISNVWLRVKLLKALTPINSVAVSFSQLNSDCKLVAHGPRHFSLVYSLFTCCWSWVANLVKWFVLSSLLWNVRKLYLSLLIIHIK